MDKAELYKHLEQPVITEELIKQFTHFAQRCEELKLHALAAYIFQKLIYYDPQNKHIYVKHFLDNTQVQQNS
jgi:hypothetical protein